MSVERRVALVVESSRKLGELPSWAAAWHENGRPVKRRVGRAWLAPTGSRDAKSDGKTYGKTGAWTQRRGRPRDGALDEVAARVRAAEVAKQAASEQRAAHQAADRTERTFRALARQWQKHMLRTGAHKPSTARDIASVLAEPGVAHRRGAGVTAGRVMQHLGDLRAEEVTVAHVERVFDAYDDAGASPRTVNKAREIVRAIYNYGADPDLGGWGLAANPASRTARRRVSGAAGVRSFEIEQVEAIARTAESGAWREPRPADWTRDELTVAEEAEENHQLADLIRLAAYTGLRQGELVVLRWRDADFAGRVLTVERALSGTVELSPKSGTLRVVPLADQALAALDRLSRRANFTAPDDYVFASLTGERPDPSALRRRYNRARDAAGAPPLPFHALRHTAASLFVRKLDPITVQVILGHASVKTTERYLHARRASSLADDVTAALTPDNGEDRDDERALLAALRALPAERRAELLDSPTGGSRTRARG
jgi:integrase